MRKKQKAIKGSKFEDSQNSINDAISAGFIDDTPNIDFFNNVPHSTIPQNTMHHAIVVEYDEEEESAAQTEHQDDDANFGNDEIVVADEGYGEIESNIDDHVN